MLPSAWPPSTSPSNFRGPVSPGTCGIVIPMRDGMPFFKLALYSLLYFTDWPWTLCVVDNMSGLETRMALRKMAPKHNFTVVRYDEEFNFAAECNLGLRTLFSNPNVEYGVVLNSDAVVSPLWLSELLYTFTHPNCGQVGIAGPISNVAIPEQQKLTQNLVEKTERVSGFCMAIKRKVFEELQGFDEGFKGGGYEDWDICERALLAGHEIAVNRRVHVTHYWKCSRRGPDHDKAMAINREKFFAKHSRWQERLGA